MQTNKIYKNYSQSSLCKAFSGFSFFQQNYHTLLYLSLTLWFAGFSLNIWHEFLEILFGGGDYIFSPSYFQYLFFHVEFNLLGEVPWSLFGKITFGADAKALGNFEVQAAPSRSQALGCY